MDDEYDQEDANKELIKDMVRCMDDLAYIILRMDSQPVYGRDARQLGVEDGHSFSPSANEIREKSGELRELTQRAIDAGIIEKMPSSIARLY